MESNGKGRAVCFPKAQGPMRPRWSGFQYRMVTMTDFTRVFIHGLRQQQPRNQGNLLPREIPGDAHGRTSPAPLRREWRSSNRALPGRTDLILVGSSYGGLMAALFACKNEARVRRLILLAPALGHADFSPYYAKPLELPVTLYHGRQDIVVPPDRPVGSRSGSFGTSKATSSTMTTTSTSSSRCWTGTGSWRWGKGAGRVSLTDFFSFSAGLLPCPGSFSPVFLSPPSRRSFSDLLSGAFPLDDSFPLSIPFSRAALPFSTISLPFS